MEKNNQCLSCKLALWDLTQKGKLHPSGDGRCQWKMPAVPIPVSFYYLGYYRDQAPAPMGGQINRREALRPNCPCFTPNPNPPRRDPDQHETNKNMKLTKEQAAILIAQSPHSGGREVNPAHLDLRGMLVSSDMCLLAVVEREKGASHDDPEATRFWLVCAMFIDGKPRVVAVELSPDCRQMLRSFAHFALNNLIGA